MRCWCHPINVRYQRDFRDEDGQLTGYIYMDLNTSDYGGFVERASQMHPLAQAKSWLPLLQFSQGNPLTIRSMAAQAARKKYITQEQVESFVAALRDGEAAFDDETSEGRSRSLGASLAYCFEKGFTENERKQLALLHMFQGSASADLLITVLGLLNHRQLGVQTLTRTIFI